MNELHEPLTWLDSYAMYVMLALMMLILTLYSANRTYKHEATKYRTENTILKQALSQRTYYVAENSFQILTKGL